MGSSFAVARLLRALRSFTLYHFWLTIPWLALAFIAACFALSLLTPR
jgi:hypothetical protein